MKKNQTKLVAILLAAIMIFVPLASCGDGKPADTTVATTDPITPTDTTESAEGGSTSEEPAETTEPEDLFDTPETFTIAKEGYALNVELTRPQKSDKEAIEVKGLQHLAMYISDKFGVFPTINTDWARVEDSEKFEIIFGATDHPETAEVLGTINYGQYTIKAVGNKIIILSYTENGYDQALAHVKELISSGLDKSAKTVTFSVSQLEKTETVDTQMEKLPYYDGGMYYATYDAGRVTDSAECDEIIVKSTTVAEYDEYLKKLEANGYTKYTENNIGQNKFATYTSNKYTLNVGYYSYEKAARLLIEPRTALTGLESENKTTKVTSSQITMIGVSQGTTQNGLSTLIRLEDGRFIVIDGAHNDNTTRDDFINTIKEQANGYTQRPVIAAWIITHSHGDHSGLLYGKYSDIKKAGITVERIILNEISATEAARAHKFGLTAGNSGTYSYTENEGGQSKRIIETVAPFFGADLYKAHVGQTFFISNCRMDVLYSLEAYAPNVCNSFNTTSIVIKMTFTDSATGKETTFLSTGDATGFGMETVNNIFDEYMQCDILSINHHGYTTWGGNSQMIAAFKKVSPTLLLWPVGDNDYSSVAQRDYNKVLFDLDSYRESYNAGNRDTGSKIIVPLPYVVGNVQKIKG